MERPKNTIQQTVVIPRLWDGRTLQEFLADRLRVSKRQAKAMLDARVVWVNRKLTWIATHTLRAGDWVTFSVAAGTGAKTKEKKTVGTDCHIRILARDDFYIFVDKPVGWLTQGEGSLEEHVRRQEGNPAISAVHRLDRETSGVLLMALSEEALNAAIEMFKTHKVEKIYHAIVLGKVDRREGTLRETLDGERAVTRYTRLMANPDASFLKIGIETGRTHQIRLHFSGIRHPIVGDRQYGLKESFDPRIQAVTRQMLHATEIELPHPVRPGEKLRAHSPLPADFRSALKLFGLGKRAK